jgi:hypothetical protein
MKKSQKLERKLSDGICRLNPKSSKKLSDSQKFASGLLEEIRPGGLKNNKTQIEFKKPNLKR